MEKKCVISATVVLLAVLAGLDAAALFSDNSAWSAVLSPLAAALSGVVLLAASIRPGGKKASVILLLLAFACFSRLLGDIVLVMLRLQERGAEGSLPVALAYALPGVLLTGGAFAAGRARNGRWRLLSGLAESLVIWMLGVHLIWKVFLAGNIPAVISAASIPIGLFLCVMLLVMLKNRDGKGLPLPVVLIAAGMLLCGAADVVRGVQAAGGQTLPKAVSELAYTVGLALCATGAFPVKLKRQVFTRAGGPPERPGRSGWPFLLAFPAAAVAAGRATGYDILIDALLIVLYQAAVSYFRLAGEKEELNRNRNSISESLQKRLDDQLQQMTALANQDTITRLCNRRHFSTCVSQAIEKLKQGEKLAVLQFDVDRFKTINDSYGHDVGDLVIVEIAKRLLEWNMVGAVLARIGGDEFAVMVTGNLTMEILNAYSLQLIAACAAPIFVQQQVLYITVSIGISVCPDDARDAVTLAKNSDIAMYKAKAEGYNKHVFYTPVFEENITRKNEIEALLRKADLSKDFELVFQPQFALPDERLIGAEALVRWRNAEHGYIPPSVFVPVAEEIDYINRIGKWVLIKAVGQIIEWNRKYGLGLKMGVNISPKQLLEDDFFVTLKTLVFSSGVAAWLDAEITENLMIGETAKVGPIFDLFKEFGISVSIDDFGSGYSSLGYINKYHFDRIKIDKSLIDNLLIPGGSGAEVVRAIVTMADAVGKTTIAEGVETREQLELLRSLGCRQVQGYLLGRPVHADVFVARFIEQELWRDGSGRAAVGAAGG